MKLELKMLVLETPSELGHEAASSLIEFVGDRIKGIAVDKEEVLSRISNPEIRTKLAVKLDKAEALIAQDQQPVPTFWQMLFGRKKCK